MATRFDNDRPLTKDGFLFLKKDKICQKNLSKILEAPFPWGSGVWFGEAEEGLLPKERYALVPEGGRVKIAGVSFQILDQITKPFIKNPSPQAAAKVMETFRHLRQDPPSPIREAFFPSARQEVKILTRSSPALLRPILKTDQGPGGNFLGFTIGDLDQPVPFQITRETGVAILEEFFARQLNQANVSEEIVGMTSEVQSLFQKGEENECFMVLERLSCACKQSGIIFQRKADIGRLPFFFIRPADAGEVVFPTYLIPEVERKVNYQVRTMEKLAEATREYVSEGMRVTEAISRVEERVGKILSSSSSPTSRLIYFQPDVIIRRDGSFGIERINFPDVGLFLFQISVEDQVFERTRGIAAKIAERVTQEIVKEIRNSRTNKVVLVTRDEVLKNDEDVLEILEMRAINSLLSRSGINTEVRAISEIDELPRETFVLLLNVASSGKEFSRLLERSAREGLRCYPDPFLLLYKDLATSLHTRILLSGEVEAIKAIVDPQRNTPEDCLRQVLALDSLLTRLGFQKETIFYFYDYESGIDSAAAAFRYDPIGFILALKSLSGAKTIGIRGLNFTSEDAVISGLDGPRLAAFRFMGVRKGG